MKETIPVDQKQVGWIESITSKINIDSFLKKFNITTATLVEMVTYFGVGIALGFFIKRYLKFVIALIIILFLIVKGFEYTGISSFVLDWGRIKELTGIAPTDTIGSIVRIKFEWIQHHAWQAVSLAIGVLVGLKLG